MILSPTLTNILFGILSGLIAAELHSHRLKINHYLRMWFDRHSPQADILREAVNCLYLEPWKAEMTLRRIIDMIDPAVLKTFDNDPHAASCTVDPDIAADAEAAL